jgi:predicted metalloprotease with PDZ domain
VMRTMFERYPLSGTGYTLADLRKVIEEFGGGSFKEFFDNYFYGTTPLDWEKYLGYAGLQLSSKDTVAKPWLGLVVPDGSERLRVFQLVAGTPAYEAGLNVGDEIVAMDGYRVRASELNTRPAEMKAGEKVRLTVFRNDKLREFTVTLQNRAVGPYSITKVKEPNALQKSIYERWFGATW